MISKANSWLGFITIFARWALGTFPSCFPAYGQGTYYAPSFLIREKVVHKLVMSLNFPEFYNSSSVTQL